MDFVSFIKTDWAVVSEAPFTFIIGAILIAALTYAFVRVQFSDRISSLNGRLKLKDDRIAEYEQNTGTQTPDEAKQVISSLEKRLEALEPRKLTQSQIDALKKVLCDESGSVRIVKDGAAANVAIIASQTMNIFQQCKWNVAGGFAIGIGLPPPTGIAITIIADNGASHVGEVILKAFNEAKVPFDLRHEKPDEFQREDHEVEILFTNELG